MASLLTDDQRSKLELFKEITQIEDDSICSSILSQNGWDVSAAVTNFMSGNISTTTSPTTAAANPLSSSEVWRNVDGDINPAENTNPVEESWISGTFSDYLKWMFYAKPSVINPDSDTRSFIQNFNQKYGLQHPGFQTSSYRNAVVEALRQRKILLVYIHSPLHEDTDRFCEQVLSTQSVTQYVNDQCVFWAGSVWNTEAFNLSLQLQATTFPFVAAIVCQSDRIIQVIGRLSGDTHENDESFLTNLRPLVTAGQAAISQMYAQTIRR